MRKFVAIALCFAIASGIVLGGDWKPGSKTVSIRVGASAGGGTDVFVRALAAAMEKEMGGSFQVVNNPGGGGGIAMFNVWKARHDGYTMVGAHDGMPSLVVSGAFDKTVEVWDWMIGAGSYAVLSVHSDSPYRTFDELLNAAKTQELKIGASTPTCTLGIKYAQLSEILAKEGIKFNYLSYEGSSPTNVAALSKEIDVVITAVAEQIEYIRAGHFRPLAAIELHDVEVEGIGMVKSLADWFPEFKNYNQVFQWWGLAVPMDVDKNVRLSYQKAFQKAMQSQIVIDAMKNMTAVPFGGGAGLVGDEASARIKAQESGASWALFDAGLVKESPDKFGIER